MVPWRWKNAKKSRIGEIGYGRIEERHMHRWGNTKPLTLVGGLGPSIGICLTLLPCRSLERICIQESINANIHLNQEETSNREQEN